MAGISLAELGEMSESEVVMPFSVFSNALEEDNCSELADVEI